METKLERYFNEFRKDIIGVDQTFISPYGEKKIIYTDWTASGRLYRPIEEKILNEKYDIKQVINFKKEISKILLIDNVIKERIVEIDSVKRSILCSHHWIFQK
jgi:hypothetical protein